MRPSIARVNEQLDPRFAASRYTIIVASSSSSRKRQRVKGCVWLNCIFVFSQGLTPVPARGVHHAPTPRAHSLQLGDTRSPFFTPLDACSFLFSAPLPPPRLKLPIVDKGLSPISAGVKLVINL